ncbi:MAG TPA: Fur family transcriptional regulator [Acidimicrobiales bacterium]
MTNSPADILRHHGVQATAQRLAVLRAVSEHPHITADNVTEVARNEIGAISRQAVYDSLAVLLDKGLIRRIQPIGSAARYEDRVDDNHHHLICRQCGRLVDVDCAVGSAPCLTAADDMGYEIDEAEVAYWGRCPQCLNNDDVSVEFDSLTPRRQSPHTSTRKDGNATTVKNEENFSVRQ